jgi:hypothetical protein
MPINIPFTARVAVPDGVLARNLEGESVVLNLKTEKYFGLDEVGTRMWTLLTDATSIQSAYDSLAAEYDVEPAQLRVDMEKLISDLVEHGLLVVSE